ncbi:hypothetical protein AGMMS50230_07310 [Spirochaetia bacterium]|nr:hypothetical protein AGMMS50230_07310 [Spirochaetia bacterium]
MTNERKRILLIDNNELHLLSAEKMLKNEYNIFIAKSGKEAMDYFIRGLFPDIVLLDIVMPQIDGWETFNRIRAMSFLKDVPILFLKSLNDSSEKKRAVEMGLAEYISKPYKKDDLKNRIKKYLE